MAKNHLTSAIMANIIILLFTLIMTFSIVLYKNANSFLRFLCLGIFIATIWLLLKRDTYLPFLGEIALPSSLIKDIFSPENSNVEVNIPIKAPNGTKILYWGALPSDKTQLNPFMAYGNYSNAGVAYVDNGNALIRFNCPSKYNVPFGHTLNRHIHYRITLSNGMMSPVKTVFVNC
jgi:hypothetical protein